MNGPVLLSGFLMGILGSVHCAAMCGGISGVLSGGLVPLGKRPPPRASLHVAMSVGRASTYASLGAVVGGLGSTLSDSAPLRGIPIVLRAFAALALVVAGLHLAGIARPLVAVERAGRPLWKWVEPQATRLLPVRSARTAFVFGALWGLLPCGLVYAALVLAAATGSAFAGAATMALFALGTMPALVSVAFVGKLVAPLFTRRWMRLFAGAVVVGVGLLNVASVVQMAGAGEVPGAAVCCAPSHR